MDGKMIRLLILLFSAIVTNFAGDTSLFDTLTCPENQECMLIDYCPTVTFLMSRNELPIHSLRELICGYDSVMPKVCCSTGKRVAIDAHAGSYTALFFDSKSYMQCGKSLVRSNIHTLGSYPFVARIGFIDVVTGSVWYPCSGVILNERTVLTTATCTLASSSRYKLYTVLIGEYDTATNPDCNPLFCAHKTYTYNVSYVIRHLGFHEKTLTNNIALVRLEQPIRFSVTAQPVCLMPENSYVATGSSVVLIGWGGLPRQAVKSTVQRSLQMNIVPKQECSAFARQQLTVELCALGDQEPCAGYSGGPLLLRYADTYFLTGLLSYGPKCERDSNLPSVFIDVHNYRRWIQENC